MPATSKSAIWDGLPTTSRPKGKPSAGLTSTWHPKWFLSSNITFPSTIGPLGSCSINFSMGMHLSLLKVWKKCGKKSNQDIMNLVPPSAKISKVWLFRLCNLIPIWDHHFKKSWVIPGWKECVNKSEDKSARSKMNWRGRSQTGPKLKEKKVLKSTKNIKDSILSWMSNSLKNNHSNL